jgi:WD40 repeat protein
MIQEDFRPVYEKKRKRQAVLDILLSLSLWFLSMAKIREPDRLPGIQAASFSPGGKILLTGSYDGALATWDVETGTRLGPVKRVLSILTVCFSPDGNWFAVGNADGRVAIRDAQSRAVLCGWKAHESGIMALDVSPNGRWLATGAREPGGTTLRVWRLGEKRDSPATEAFSDHRHVTPVYAVSFSRDNRFLAAGGWTNSGYSGPVVYELETGNRVASLIWEASRALGFSPDGTILASGDEWGKVSLWDIKRRCRLREIEAHEEIISVLRFSPDGRRLASGSCDGKVKLWDTASGSPCLEHTCAGIVLDCYFTGGEGLLVAAATSNPENPPQITRLTLK